MSSVYSRARKRVLPTQRPRGLTRGAATRSPLTFAQDKGDGVGGAALVRYGP